MGSLGFYLAAIGFPWAHLDSLGFTLDNFGSLGLNVVLLGSLGDLGDLRDQHRILYRVQNLELAMAILKLVFSNELRSNQLE